MICTLLIIICSSVKSSNKQLNRKINKRNDSYLSARIVPSIIRLPRALASTRNLLFNIAGISVKGKK